MSHRHKPYEIFGYLPECHIDTNHMKYSVTCQIVTQTQKPYKWGVQNGTKGLARYDVTAKMPAQDKTHFNNYKRE